MVFHGAPPSGTVSMCPVKQIGGLSAITYDAASDAYVSGYAAAVLLSLFVLIPIYLITVTAFTPRAVSYEFPKPFIPGCDLAGTVDMDGPLPMNTDCGGRRPADDVQMAIGHRVEAARVDRHASRLLERQQPRAFDHLGDHLIGRSELARGPSGP